MSIEAPSGVASKVRKHLPLIATIMVIGVNTAASIVPINGYSTGTLSDLNPTGFTPAGWVFSVWSLNLTPPRPDYQMKLILHRHHRHLGGSGRPAPITSASQTGISAAVY